MAKITENTTVSLTVLAVFLSAVGYVSYVSAQETNHAHRIEMLESSVTALQQMGIDIAVIKTKVENIEKKVDRKKGD